MSNATLPRESTTPDAPESDPTPKDALKRIYAFFYNKVVGITIILVMAVATLLGTLLRQVPDEVLAQPEYYQAWLDSVRPMYGGWTDVLSTLSLFHVFGSGWFKGIMIALALSIIACTTHRLPQLSQRAFHPHLHVSDAIFTKARYHSALPMSMDAQAARDAAASALTKRHFRVVDDPTDPHSLYADRYRLAPFGTAVAHLGFVIILAGVFVTTSTGFSEPNLPVTVGTKVAVGHNTGLTIEAKSFTDKYNADGRPMDYASDLVLYENDQQVAQQIVRVNDPLRYKGIDIHQSGFGTAAVVRVTDASGKALYDGGIALDSQSQDGQDAFGHTSIPGTNQVVYVATAASGQTGSTIKPGDLAVEVYDSPTASTPIEHGTATMNKPLKLGELTYTFVREAPYTGLQVNQDKGAIWVWIGCAMSAIGTVITMTLKHRRVWVRATETSEGTTLALASPERHDSVFERWFRGLVTELSTVKEG